MASRRDHIEAIFRIKLGTKVYVARQVIALRAL